MLNILKYVSLLYWQLQVKHNYFSKNVQAMILILNTVWGLWRYLATGNSDEIWADDDDNGDDDANDDEYEEWADEVYVDDGDCYGNGDVDQ